MINLTEEKRAEIREPGYQQTVARELDALLSRIRATQQDTMPSYDIDTGRMIVFSDQHRGAGNGADDFQRSKQAYNAALAYYFQRGHTLIEVGDVEELWEERPSAVGRQHLYSMQLSAQFHRAGRYFKIWGNHDDEWQYPAMVEKHLLPIYGDDIRVHEGVEMKIIKDGNEKGRMLFVHGHQGTTYSDKYRHASRVFVRWVWRPIQRMTNISRNTSAKSWVLREKQNIALYEWAKQKEGLILFAGHTHRPVFDSLNLSSQIEAKIQALCSTPGAGPQYEADLANLHAELAWARSQDDGLYGMEGAANAGVPIARRCYFNTGCCCYRDGDITGLELLGNTIHLVRWPDNKGKPRPEILDSCPLI